MSRSDQKNAVNRRDALTTIGIAGAAAALVGAGAHEALRGQEVASVPSGGGSQNAGATNTTTVANAPRELDAATQALVAPIVERGHVGDYRVVAVHAVKLGAIPVVLATAEGRQFQVDVLRRDAEGVNGVRANGSLTVVLHNEGRGADATDELAGLGAMALLDALAARESEGAALPALLTLSERNARFPRAMFAVA